jgi:ubiquitin-protein ligase
MKFWWLTDFSRLEAEKAAVEKLTADEPWFSLIGWTVYEWHFSATGVIVAHGAAYRVRLIYPDQFPQVPPWVEPQDKADKWSDHQYGKGGALCLELRPDNWTSQATGADMLRSAFNLLEAENPLGNGESNEVPSAHHITPMQAYTWGKNPVLVGEGCLKRLLEGTAEGVGALRWAADEDTYPMLVFDKIDRANPQHPPSFDLGTLRFELPVWVVETEAPSPVPSDKAELAAAMGIDLDSAHTDGAVLAIAVGKAKVTPFHVIGPNSVFERKWVMLPDQEGVRSGRSPETESKKVAVIGLGSVGSKIAETLLRSGVRRFLLVDGDVLFPANLERHTLDWRDVGFRKARAIERRLRHIVSGATVDVITANLNWQRSAKTHGYQIQKIAECDLIIDATGDDPTSMFLGAIAAENQKVFVSVEVFEGGLGCMITRAIPGRDPAYIDARNSYTAYCDEQNVAPPSSGRRPYEILNEDAEPIVADDTAATIAAGHAARIVLDILDSVVDNEETALKLIGFKKGWLFKSHGHVIALDLGGPRSPTEPEASEEIRMFASGLAKEALDAVKDSE